MSAVEALEISFLIQTQDDARVLAFAVCNRGRRVIDATAVAEFDSPADAMAYTLLLKNHALRTGLGRALISSLKGCPWLDNTQVGFEVDRQGDVWAVRVASGRLSNFLALFSRRQEAQELVSLLHAARAFRLWTSVGGQASA